MSKVQAKLDNGAFAEVTCMGCGTASATWSVTAPAELSEGSHTISVRAVDESVRPGLVATGTFTTDYSPPTFTSISAVDLSSTITATFSEPITTCVGGFPVTINSAGKDVTPTCSSSAVSLALPTGTVLVEDDEVEVTVVLDKVKDAAGNAAPVAARSTTVA